MNIVKFPTIEEIAGLLTRGTQQKEIDKKVVVDILQKVSKEGDVALFDMAQKYEGAKLQSLLVSEEEFNIAEKETPSDLKEAILLAQRNIEKFHLAQRQKENQIETTKGVKCWRETRAIEKVGLYIPGGTAPLFSTVLMLAIPAKIAGCKEIIMCSPCNKRGKIHPAILFAAKQTGIKKIFKVGGAQAIAAMAYGTKSIPATYKIFGPGNQYVTMAKQLVQEEGVAIDMPAGPSELMIIADETAIPAFVASDLLSQAEHGVDSQVVLVSSNEELIKNVSVQIEEQLNRLPRKEIAQKALENSVVILTKEEAFIDIVNDYAPEHLILCTKNTKNLLPEIQNAGSVFIGNYTPESAGDYASGTNHTLPTNGFAKAYSGVSLDSFVKKITFQEISKEGLQNIGPSIEVMAENEALQAHKNAVSIRLK